MLKILQVNDLHQKEKIAYVLNKVREIYKSKVIGFIDLHISLSDKAIKTILATTSDIEGLLLKDNKKLTEELDSISESIVNELIELGNSL